MDKDIVYDESEISIAANQLVNYSDFLGQCIDEYGIILKELKSNGIEDDKVCANIEELINTILPYKSQISNMSKNLKNTIHKSMSKMVLTEKFTFSTGSTSMVGIALSRFI